MFEIKAVDLNDIPSYFCFVPIIVLWSCFICYEGPIQTTTKFVMLSGVPCLLGHR